jgi:hypothetical protein
MSRWLVSSANWGKVRQHHAMLLVALLGPNAACATPSARGAATSVHPVRSEAAVLTRAELGASPASTAFSLHETLRQIRPFWLDDRGTQSVSFGAGVQVALDGHIIGDIGVLNRLRAGDVEEARILGVAEAALRYGTSAQAQRVIELTSRRGWLR